MKKILCSILLSISLLINYTLNTYAWTIDFSTLSQVFYNNEEIDEIYLNNELVWEANSELIVFENNIIQDNSVFASYVNSTLSSVIEHYDYSGNIISDSHSQTICTFTDDVKGRYPYMVVEFSLKSSLKTGSGGSNSGAMSAILNISSEQTSYDGESKTVTVVSQTKDIVHNAGCYWAGGYTTSTAQINKITLYKNNPE